ncbi:hypothetical protein ABZ570_18360 [Micromonospora sp. NPDC007271]|uniref:hypothetical protein n=1 Tax=Micromonospora sp. NPDC007271 TaxID=3154587 RepID=UPI0033C8FC20
MWESVAAPVVGLLAAVAGVAPAPTPSPAVNFAPVLTSTPFGALPGQRVTHTVTISGTGVLTATRVTFTTTADLDDVTVRAEPGECTTSPRTVVCDLGDLSLGATAGAPPRITVSGRVRPGAPPGAVVRNRVTVTSVESATTGAPVASNAYLIPGPTRPPTDPPLESPPVAAGAPPSGSARVPAIVAVVLAAAAAVGTLLLTRRRRRHQPPTHRV